MRLIILSFLSLLTFELSSQCNGQLVDAFQGFASETATGNGVIYLVSNSEVYTADDMTSTNLSNNPFADEQMKADNNTVVWSGSDGAKFNIYKSVNGQSKELVNNASATFNRNPAITGDMIVWAGLAGGFNIYKNIGNGQEQVSTSLSTSNSFPETDGTNIVWHGIVNGEQRILMDSGSGPFVIDMITPGAQVQPQVDNGVVIWRQLNIGNTTSRLYKYENGVTSVVSGSQTEVAGEDYDIADGTIVWINGVDDAAEAYASVNGGSPDLLSTTTTKNKNVRTRDGNVIWIGTTTTAKVYLLQGMTTSLISENIGANQNAGFNDGVITWVGFRDGSWRVFAKYLTAPPGCCTSNTEVSVPSDEDSRIIGDANGKLIWTGFDIDNKRQVYREGDSGPELVSQGNYDALQDVSIDGDNIYWVADNGGDIIKYDGTSETLIPTTSIFEDDPIGDGDILYWIGRPTGTNIGETEVYKLENGIETILSSFTTNHLSLRLFNGAPYWIGRDAGGTDQLYMYNGTSQVLLSNNLGIFLEAISFVDGYVVWIGGDGNGNKQVYTNKGTGQVAVSPEHPVNDDPNERSLRLYQSKLIWNESNSNPEEIYGYDGTAVSQIDINKIPLKDILHIDGDNIYYDEIVSSTTYLNQWDGIRITRLSNGVQGSFTNVLVLNGTIYYQSANRIFKFNCGGDCPNILDVPSATESRYGAETTLTSAAMISSPVMTLFSAGQNVELKSEFSIAPLATLDIVIQSCEDYLGGN